MPAHRARPVAGAPVQPLLGRTDELARRWAIALILALPLERIGEIPLESFAREAPGFLAQVLRALRSDGELAPLAAPAAAHAGQAPAVRLDELTGATGGQAAVEAIEALRGVLWEALLDELRWSSLDSSPARQVADLADRLAYVCSVALGSTLARAPDPATPVAGPELRVRRQAPVQAQPEPAPAPLEPPEQSVRAPLGGGVAIVDEAEPVLRRAARAPAPAEPRAPAANARPRRQAPAGAGAGRAHAQGRARPWDIPLAGAGEADPGDAGPDGSGAGGR
jgi:hypothetical protein